MSLLSYNRLVQLVKNGVIDAPIENINGASIDITLGKDFILERELSSSESRGVNYNVIDLINKQTIKTIYHKANSLILAPNDLILATSHETFNLPNNIACEYKLKSSLARSGLQHMLAGWCDPGWNNSKLTLGLKNVTQFHRLRLDVGMKIGQMVFFECEPVPEGQDYSAKGQYNNQDTVQSNKGLR